MPDWCDPCPSCTRKCRAIGGDGPQPARVLAILERPGQDENRVGRVAVGKAGQELDDLYLPLAGLDRSEIRVCNTVMCGEPSNKKPTDKEIAQCAPFHLPAEVRNTQPEIIILCGAVPCSLVPGIDLESMHGIPQPASKVGDLFGWSGWFVPMYHPAQGLHEGRWMQVAMEDWKGLEPVLRDWWIEEDPVSSPTHYKLIDDILDLFPLAGVLADTYTVAMDTETHNGKPWSVQVSWSPGQALLIPAGHEATLRALHDLIANCMVILHNAAYDLVVLESLGIHVCRFRDTMQEAFHLGNLPQGLKALVYRLFRHTMTSYDETVRPASIRALEVWLSEALRIAQLDFAFVERRPKSVKTHASTLESLIVRLLRNMDPLSKYNPWGDEDEPRLNAFWSDQSNSWMTAHVEARIGRYPVLGIANCRMEDAVKYACGDADWTGRVAAELAKRRQTAFQIHDGDRD